MSENRIESEEEKQWFAMIPNMVDDIGLDPYAVRLYLHFKRVTGEHGVCWQSTRTLAKHCKMSMGSVSNAKKALSKHGLIRVVEKLDGKKKYHSITVVNIWQRNFEHFSRSPSERYSSPDEQHSSPGETKKNPLRRTHEEDMVEKAKESVEEEATAPAEDLDTFFGAKPEEDYAEETASYAKRGTKQSNDNGTPPRGWRAASDGELAICQRIAERWTDHKLPWSPDDIERSLATAHQFLEDNDGDVRKIKDAIDRYHLKHGDDFTVTSAYSLRNALPKFIEESQKPKVIKVKI